MRKRDRIIGLSAMGGAVASILISFALSAVSANAQTELPAVTAPSYDISFDLDPEARSFAGTERIRWTNNDDKPTNTLYFHLYPNLRVPEPMRAPEADHLRSQVADSPDEPRLEVTDIRAGDNTTPLTFNYDETQTTMRVFLREAVPGGGSTELVLKFKGTVPLIDPDETGILAHVVQQVDAALRNSREIRRARDINFSCRGILLLGAAYPVLAARTGDDWQRKVESSIGDTIFADTADYRVVVNAPLELSVYTSGEEAIGAANHPRVFVGHNLRSFALIAGANFKFEERQVGGLTIRSVYLPEQEKIGHRVLNIASAAAAIYVRRFGPLPSKQLRLVQMPLVAGIGCLEFTNLGAVASAFYVDFDSPQIRNLPEMIREQRTSVEDSLEWMVAHAVAQQWWGATVGNDPDREPVLDEALSNWSALLYYEDAFGKERAAAAQDDQLRGVYKVYRTFGGEDMPANRSAHEYRNFFQYAAIVNSKGALLFTQVRNLIGEERFFAGLRKYYSDFKFQVAELNDLRGAWLNQIPEAFQRRAVERLFTRWLSAKHGDEDIAPPDAEMAASLGIPGRPPRKNDRNAFAKLGKFFWQQMTRIR
ncbi:MAG: M1 family aminopeptidase [Pyrinomonadaceae bacterium]